MVHIDKSFFKEVFLPQPETGFDIRLRMGNGLSQDSFFSQATSFFNEVIPLAGKDSPTQKNKTSKKKF